MARYQYAVVAGLAAFASASAIEKRQTGQCSTLHVMAAGGCHLPCTTDSLSFLSTTVAGITGEIPGSDLYLVPYDGSQKQAAVSGPLLNQAIAQYTADCPNTPIVLVGYSLGGIIITNSVCGQVPYTKNIIASVTYGEETFAYPTSYDRGTCRENAPLYARQNTAACDAFAPVMRSYCDALDPNCCSSGDPANNAAHFQYAGKYDSEVAAYVLAQYNAFTGGSKPLPGSSTSSAASTSFSTMPYYKNSSIPVKTMSSSAAAMSSGGPGPVSAASGSVTTIPLYEPTSLSTPVNPTGTAVPNSVGAEPTMSGPQVVAVGSGSGVAVVTSIVGVTGVAPSGAQATGDMASGSMEPSSTLTPANPNGASTLGMHTLTVVVAMLAASLFI